MAVLQRACMSESAHQQHMSPASLFELTAFGMSAAEGDGPIWDVFISHRGADSLTNTNIKKTFVSFLHARLEQAGVTSFTDEQSLKPGDAAWRTVRDIISRCSIAIPVLTESYGNSEACLEELFIMNQASSVKVMPLFLNNDAGKVLQTIKDASEKLKDEVSQSTFLGWQEAVVSIGLCNESRHDQMSR